LCDEAGVVEPCSLNLCVTDGVHVVATRFRNGEDSPPSLYYNYGSTFMATEGTFMYPGDEHCCDLVISSAPLCKDFYCEDYGGDSTVDCGSWVLVPKNTMLVCVGDPHDHTKIQSIHLLPIVVSTWPKSYYHGLKIDCDQSEAMSGTQRVFPSPSPYEMKDKSASLEFQDGDTDSSPESSYSSTGDAFADIEKHRSRTGPLHTEIFKRESKTLRTIYPTCPSKGWMVREQTESMTYYSSNETQSRPPPRPVSSVRLRSSCADNRDRMRSNSGYDCYDVCSQDRHRDPPPPSDVQKAQVVQPTESRVACIPLDNGRRLERLLLCMIAFMLVYIMYILSHLNRECVAPP
jgi:hypothetical protein